MNDKILIYQVLPRLFGNANTACVPNGTLAENGVGKLNDFDEQRLAQLKDMGYTHVWYTGVIRHATCTDYTAFNIPRQHCSVVKGQAGSPYAIADYYDIDPDLAVDVDCRMQEFEQLIARTHAMGLKVVIDFVPNHVAREYRSICKPEQVKDLGQDDDKSKHFDPQNNFYYCPGVMFVSPVAPKDDEERYEEDPAKCTGNDHFDAHPGINDWYETVKLNYGIDYTAWGGRRYCFNPMPDTWHKMTEILLYWASKGVDAFRCDMAEMVPTAFWHFATEQVKACYPDVNFIGEVYDPSQYRSYIGAGFDYLYDKVGMYDCIKDVICHRRPASDITYFWQGVDDIKGHMLYFLENHDEQRIASDYFCGNALNAIPGIIVSALLMQNPFMIYSGQEFGERGMDAEGFSGQDGRTTIFDYWYLDSTHKGFFDRVALSEEQVLIEQKYHAILKIASQEAAVAKGDFFDLMYVNPTGDFFDQTVNYAFLRKYGHEVLLVCTNFGDSPRQVRVRIPAHAFDYLQLGTGEVCTQDLLHGTKAVWTLSPDCEVTMEVGAHDGCVYKFSTPHE